MLSSAAASVRGCNSSRKLAIASHPNIKHSKERSAGCQQHNEGFGTGSPAVPAAQYPRCGRQ